MESLIFINLVGKTHKGEYIYEFLFSDKIDIIEITGEDWDIEPANGKPSPPDMEYITDVGILKTKTVLELAQNSDTFSMIDVMDDVISIAWEKRNEEEDETYHKRLVFRFGDTKQQINDKLYERDLILKKPDKIEL